MIKGTTPTHVFTIPFDTSSINKVRVIYAQNEEILFVKETEDCVVKDNTIEVTLTQTNTLLFDHKKPAEIQLRILTKAGDALASVVERVGVGKLLENEVFT